MFGSSNTTDKALQKSVTRRMERSGAGSQSGLAASVLGGTVTLTGKLKYENQRIPLVKAVRGVSGVRNVVDRLQSPPKMGPPPPQHGNAR